MKILELIVALFTMLIFLCIAIACATLRELRDLQEEENKKSKTREED